MDVREIWVCVAARWQPTVGDPGAVGWITAAAYLAAAVLSLAAAVSSVSSGRRTERAFWIAAGLGLAALAVNKQLDLQQLAAALGRCLARAQGWYDARRTVQAAFLLGGLATAFAGGGWLLRRLSGSYRRTGPALLGLAWIAGFVLVRAAAATHVEALGGLLTPGAPATAAVELAGIAIFAAGAAAALRGDRRD